MMSEKHERIEQVLRILRDIAKENPEIDFGTQENKNFLYRYLVRVGVDITQHNINVATNGYFEGWIKTFESVNNIDCFVSLNHDYFCQFVNTDRGQAGHNDYVKMYIPLDAEHLYQGAIMIFEYLAQNNIIHESKIGKHIRFDDIVVRLTKESDARKLTEFVKNNEYIQEGLIKASPFAFNRDGIAYACDGHISYNSTMADLLSVYIQQRKSENSLDEINITDFYGFLMNYYHDVFSNAGNVERLISDFELSRIDNDIVENYKQVIALIIKSFNSNMTFEDYFAHFEVCNSGMKGIDYLNMKSSNVQSLNVDGQDMHELLFEAIDVMSQKYGRTHAIEAIENYLITGDITYLTRQNNIRQKLVNSNCRDYFNEILSKTSVSFGQYLYFLEQKRNMSSSKDLILAECLRETYQKYEHLHKHGQCDLTGQDVILRAVKKLALNGEYDGFTRENSAREKMLKNFTKEEFVDLLARYNDIQSYNKKLIDTMCTKFINDFIDMEQIKTY